MPAGWRAQGNVDQPRACATSDERIGKYDGLWLLRVWSTKFEKKMQQSKQQRIQKKQINLHGQMHQRQIGVQFNKMHRTRRRKIFFLQDEYWKLEWDWNRIRSRSFPGSERKTTKHKHNHTSKHQATAPLPGKFAKLSETRWNKTRPSQPLISSLPPCSNPPRHPLFRCQPYLHLDLYPQAGL